MKLRIVMPLVLSAAALTGCQQLNDGVNTINGAISSSLSSVGKALGGTATTQSLGPVSSVSGLGAVCKDYEENAMAAEKKWTGKRISIANATVLEVTKGRSASDMMTGMPMSTPNYYLLFKTADTSYCGGMVWLDYYSGIDDAVLTYKKGQKVSVTGTVNNFEVRGFATVNNADMPVRLVVLRNGTINY
ncbi:MULTISPECIES: hypothetical protein [Enterobacteriaceae]|jgi:hypothetical protein|uniref:Lipoprotein n=2 Tax=Enterobacteriaceae TaxID=543 RepID=A0A6L6IMS0_9ENTR|nr:MULTISPECIES: hypothetical protein [Enterobacteriaceae]EEF0845652.1 hypothetical protein [Salmonella enterica subsp. enterica serovar Mbandaka]HBQ5495635.1 hypothetical protein [Klebsiella pneumoniae]MBV5096196.1 hypothetical protein [Tenebrionicola larvae]MTH48162.1 hypothetical protein [Intestinirhabdus alba]HBR1086534.1 hypothetical protein [Klebsiella pneumoniae]